MNKPAPVTGSADWTNLLKDPDLASHLGELLQVYREAAPEQRTQALLDTMRRIKAAAAQPHAPETSPTIPQLGDIAAKSSPPFEPDTPAPSWVQDRRRYPRLKCFVAVELHVEGSSAPVWGNLANTSLGGCQIETVSPLPIGSRLEIGLWLSSGKLWVKGLILDGVVDNADPSCGIRVKFGELDPADRESLRQFLKYVEQETMGYHYQQGYLAQLKR